MSGFPTGGSGSSVTSPPYLQDPTVFLPSTNGAKGDTKFGSSGTIGSGLTAFSDANGAFTAADVGKVFALSALTKTGADLITTIAAFVSSTAVTLAAGPAVTYSANAFYAYGTDDTVAIQATINAAVTAFQNPNNNAILGGKGKAVIQFEEAGYMINGALVQTSGYNTQLTLPILVWTDNTISPFFIEFRGRGEYMPTGGFTETKAPVIGGTMLFSTQSNPAVYSNTTGLNSVIGCRSVKGTIPPISMVVPTVRGVNFVFPFNVGAAAMDFGSCSGAVVERTAVFTNAPQDTVNLQSAPWQVSTGVVMPQVNNSGINILNDFYVYNCQVGIVPGEHTNGRNWCTSGCITAIGGINAAISVSYLWNEGATVQQLDTFICKYQIAGADFTNTTPPSLTNRMNMTILSSQIEESTGGAFIAVNSIKDANNKVFGVWHYQHVTTGVGPSAGLTAPTGGANITLFDDSAGAPTFTIGTDTSTAAVATTPAVTSGVGFIPSALADTMVYVPVAATTTGTVTITMGPTTGAENTPVPASNLVALSEPCFTLRVPAGWTVIVTKTGTTVAIGTVTAIPC